MARRKSIDKYTVDDLLAYLDATPKQLAENSDVFKFIEDFKLKEGKKFYPNSVIYYLYCKNKKYRKLSRAKFFRYFSKFFKVKTLPRVRGYLLSDNFQPSIEDYFNARIHTRKEKYEKKNKKSQEGKG